MLHINELTYRVEGRALLARATLAVPAGQKVGLVGRNGAGKSTLFALIRGALAPDDGTISLQRNARLGHVAQEAPAGPESLLETVLAADTERAALLAEAETASDPHRIADIHTRLTDIDAHSAPARAGRILAGLGFSAEEQARPCADFSGGWRMRVALAGVLFSAPDVLLLDEPSNYLDLEGTLWLTDYLRTYPHTVVLISHDREILNAVPDMIVHLTEKRLFPYPGNFDRFERLRAQRIEQQLQLKARQDEQRRHLQAFVDRFRAKASKARQAQSRLKAIAKLAPIPDIVEERMVPFTFPDPRPLASPLIRLEDAATGYGETRILSGLNLRIDSDDRIALLGKNGNGKSTLAKLLSGRLPLQAGALRKHKKVDIAYIAQHQLDELDAARTPYDYFEALMPEATIAQRRSRCAAAGFGHAHADLAVGKLSGGEKARLLLAVATFHGPHMLILDEPTNHLDIDARSALITALAEYQGAVILISHDVHLIETSIDRLWLVADGTVTPFEGDVDDYRRLVLESERGAPRPGPGRERPASGPQASAEARATARREAAERRREIAPLRKAAEAAEKRCHALTDRRAAIDAALGEPGLFERNAERALQLTRERGQVEKEIAAAEAAWLEALEAYETARAEVEGA
ncbi:MAG: ABC-F family ATP-binding cassette domain-containing protein [Alphaproteobacteria bacterium]|nr:ABC-F family ATP-binding cassette domain-containing protein [Alphaproteobacteria bacterium]